MPALIGVAASRYNDLGGTGAANQILIHKFARDRCRHGAAVAAILDDYRNSDLRVVDRRESDEQCGIAQMLGGAALHTTFGLTATLHLRGAGLAGDFVRRVPADAARRAAFAVHHG